jgi:hypothetical protein
MEIFGNSVITIPFIVGLVYAITEVIKLFLSKKYPDINKFLPIIAGVSGIAISIIIFFVEPEIIPATTWYYSAIIGLASGLSAVGINQVGKQIKKGGEKGGS